MMRLMTAAAHNGNSVEVALIYQALHPIRTIF
jgi:hypothetical protein